MKKYNINYARKLVVSFFFVVMLNFISNYAAAQNKWTLTFRPGVNFATKDLGDAKLKTGFGLEGTIAYNFMPNLAIYTGWSWNKFSANQSFAGANMDFDETGYCFGLQIVQPFGSSKTGFMLRGGGLYNHIEIENSEGKIIADSGHGLGWEIETGLSVPLGNSLRFIPGIRYRALSRDIKFNNVTTPVDLNYISVGAGLSWSFGK